MSEKALGLIETIGMAAAIEAADAALKSANVELIGYELTKGGGMVLVKIEGEVGAVKAGLQAAKVSASRVNRVYQTLLIARPAENLNGLVKSSSTIGITSEEKKTGLSENAAPDNQEEQDKEINTDTQEQNADENQQEIKNEDEDIEKTREEAKDNDLKEKIKENIQEENKEEVCNICGDEECPRRKGQPKYLCIHYKKDRLVSRDE